MLYKGEIIIAQDRDIRDMYLCQVTETAEHEALRSVTVRILEMVRYPIQHAVMYPEIASENPPLLPETRAQLRLVGRVQGLYPLDGKNVSPAEYYAALGAAGYFAGFTRCLDAYARSVEARLRYQEKYPHAAPHSKIDPEELRILARHRAREFHGARSCLTQEALHAWKKNGEGK